VGCFAPLKKAYGRQIEDLARNHIFHISKLEFLPAFKAAFDAAFTANNICASFRGAGLIPLDPEAVLSKLDVQLRTPSPPVAQEVAQWESKTPSNAVELGCQTALIRSRIQRHQDSSPTLLESIDSLERGAQKFRHELVLVRDKVASLEKTIEAATKRKERSKKRIQKQGTLTKGEGSERSAQIDIEKQIESETLQGIKRSRPNAQQPGRCRHCRKIGHNARTCQNEAETAVD
jgi:hypothetical protein